MSRTKDPAKLEAERLRRNAKNRGKYGRLSETEKEHKRAQERTRYREKRAGQWIRWKRQALKNARHRAERKGVEFALVESNLTLPEYCPVLGIPIIIGDPAKNNSPSLDRVDPTLGYTVANTRIISNRANAIKRNASLAELKAIVNYVETELGA